MTNKYKKQIWKVTNKATVKKLFSWMVGENGVLI
jgi:hypothetical protein